MSKPLPEPIIDSFGDSAVLLRYAVDGYSDAANRAVLALAEHLRAQGGWTDVVCGYDSVMATFDPVDMKLGAAMNRVHVASKASLDTDITERSVIDIAVHYGGADGPDMPTIMAARGLSEAEVIKTHSAPIYRVCMMGFVPGFAFLSAAPKKLHHPRLATPRASVPAGSIGIAGWQTGIYGLSSPGGWQIIGRTESPMFDPAQSQPFTLRAGDHVRFVPTPKFNAGVSA